MTTHYWNDFDVVARPDGWIGALHTPFGLTGTQFAGEPEDPDENWERVKAHYGAVHERDRARYIEKGYRLGDPEYRDRPLDPLSGAVWRNGEWRSDILGAA